MKVEILSPAGSSEHLIYALRGGADGVYLGTTEFSARQNAANFTLSQLEEATSYCHSRGVNVYVALNTLVKNGELEKVLSVSKEICRINVDGVIIQDLAVAEILKQICPEMKLHGSTQMAIHNLEGAKTLAKLGFSRVVLARELTLDEIEKITAECGIETEVFVHGAHCMSVSGMCYLSSFIGGRSGNRGRCAQPCRLDFKSGNKDYCLSLKDMCYIEHIRKLSEIGVASLKIEGRMKRPEYAYIASKTYKKALEGERYDDELKLLKGVFSRSGFTDGYISNARNEKMFGYRKKEDVDATADAVKSIGKTEELKRIPFFASVVAVENEPLKLDVTSGEKTVSVYSDEIITKGTLLPAPERMENALGKTGGTPFYLEKAKIDIRVEKGETAEVFSVSSFNAMRRYALDKLLLALSEREDKKLIDYSLPNFELCGDEKKTPEIRIRLENASQSKNIEDFSGKIIIPYSEAEKLSDKFDKDNIVLEIPILIYPFSEKKVLDELSLLFEKGYKNVICENISFINALCEIGFNIYGGAYLNVTNPMAYKEYEKLGLEDITLSIEINMGDLKYFSGFKKGIISYGFLPLMHFRVCPVKNSLGCEKCNKKGFVKDRMNKEFNILCKKNFVSLLNTVPVSLSGKEYDADFQTLYFTKETPSEVSDILNQFIRGQEPNYPHTKGLYFRKVL